MKKLILLAAIAAAGTAVGVALATGASGQFVENSATGSVPDAFHVNSDRIKLQTKDPTNVVTRTIRYDAGATSGWHRHIGIVIVIVKDGTVTRYESDCQPVTFHAGDVFVESSELGAMVLRNETATAAHVVATFIVPPPVPQNLRIDADNPGCSVN